MPAWIAKVIEGRNMLTFRLAVSLHIQTYMHTQSIFLLNTGSRCLPKIKVMHSKWRQKMLLTVLIEVEKLLLCNGRWLWEDEFSHVGPNLGATLGKEEIWNGRC